MSKSLLTNCPYCHRKVSYFGASILKTKGEHCCSGCNCISNVVINKSIYGIASATVVISFLILFLYSMFGDHGSPWGILFVLAPFLLFYLIVPWFVKLEPCNDKSAVKKLHRKISPIPEQKQQNYTPEQPVDLDVGADFGTSFLNIKNSIKNETGEINYENNDPSEDISSGLDIDITGSMNAADDIIVEDKGSEDTSEE